MSFVLVRNTRKIGMLTNVVFPRYLTSLSIPRFGTFEPNYLDAVGVAPSIYPKINVQIKGYDYHILESFQSFIHNFSENMGIEVSESWAIPGESYKVDTFKKGGTEVQETYNLKIHERNVQLVNMRSVDVQIILDLLRNAIPPGVTLSIHEHEKIHEEAKYIPDPFLDHITSELKAIEESTEEAIAKAEEKKATKAANKLLTS